MPDLKDLSDCSTLQNEYWTHVSPQGDLPLAQALWRERTLQRIDRFVELHSHDVTAGAARLALAVAQALIDDPEILAEFRLVTSISDKRMYLDLSYLFSRSLDPNDSSRTMCGCAPHALTRHSLSFFENYLSRSQGGHAEVAVRAHGASVLIATYLIDKGLDTVLTLYTQQDHIGRESVLEKWLMPRETQQNEAKRRGHGAEAAVARVLKAVGCTIFPPEKDTNPMGARDPNISLETFSIVDRVPGLTFSSDIALLDDRARVRVAIMGLVQSSDPGQFGVNKSDEIVQLRTAIDSYVSTKKRPLELWGLVDGVGYSENKAGTINKMLNNFHYFVQTKSAYKTALRAHKLGLIRVAAISFDEDFYSASTKTQMVDRYVPVDVAVIVPSKASKLRPVEAGKATIWLN